MRKLAFVILSVFIAAHALAQTPPAKTKKKRDTVKTADKPEHPLLIVKFYSVFKQDVNGDIIALFPVKINYYTINKGGSFPENGSIGGVRLDDIKGHDLMVDTVKGTIIYKGVFK